MPVLVATLVVLACAPALADPAPDAHYELAVDPVSWLNHQYAASAATAISTHVALRTDVGADASQASGPNTAYQAGTSAQLFLERAFHGAFVEPGVVWHSAPAGVGCLGGLQDTVCPMTRTRWTSAAVLVGWQWTSDAHFTLAAAVGYSRPIAGEPSPYYGDRPQVEWYLRAGYAW